MNPVSFSLTEVRLGRQVRRIPHSGNARLHWAQRHRWNKQWASQSGWSARAAIGGGFAPGLMQAAVTITLYTIRPLDQDNAHAAIKPILDGLKGVLIVEATLRRGAQLLEENIGTSMPPHEEEREWIAKARTL